MSEPEKQPETIKPADKDLKDIKFEPASSAEQPGIKPANIPAASPATPANNNEAKANDNAVVINTTGPVTVNTTAPEIKNTAPFVAPAVETPAAPAAETPVAVTPVVETPAAVTPVAPATPATPATSATTPAETPASNAGIAPAVTPAVTEAAPAAETPPVETPVALATPAAPATETAPAPYHSRRNKILRTAFNIVAGGVTSFAVKSAATAGLAFVGAAPLLIVLGSSVAVGAVMTAWCHFGERALHKKQGQELSPLFSKAHAKEIFSKKTGKIALKSTLFAVAGGLIGMGIHEGWFTQAWNHFAHPATHAVAPVVVAPAVIVPDAHAVVAAPVAAPVAVAPVVAPVVAPIHCATPTEAFADLVKGHHVSPAVTDAVHRAASGNAHVAAQGAKDMAFYAQNGFDGVPKDPHVAVELFKQAADAGNIQAKVDLLYMQHYGLDTIAQNKAASLSAMKDIAHNARAEHFIKEWGGAGKTLPHVNFSTDTILKGVKLGCPTA